MNDLETLNHLRKKLETHSRRVALRYKKYDMKDIENEYGVTISASMRSSYRAVIGWCAKGVDTLADRLVFREFENDNFYLNEIFTLNNPDIFFDSAVLSALIASCCFVYISQGEEDIPRLQVIEASDATGIINPITGLLTSGYAVLEKDVYGRPTIEALFLPGKTKYYYKLNFRSSK